MLAVPRASLLLAALMFLACASTAARPDADAPEPEPDATATAPAVDAGAPADTAPPEAGGDAAASGVEAGPDRAADLAEVAAADSAPAPGKDAAPGSDSATELRLTSGGFLMKNGELIFPASASYPMDQSPPFAWSGAPAAARSFALTFVDKSNAATKWVVWDIPRDTVMLPGNLSKTVHPAELPTSSQRGSLGRTGYSGPGVPGPPLHVYEFVLWALDTEQLPDTAGLSTADLRTRLLPMHAVAMSAALVAKGQEGGP
jgi:Raf kinase inhibitor-like YbhB/YbcL family protein